MTKDAKTILYHMYKEYLVRRNNHMSKLEAKGFDSSKTIQATLFPDWLLEDVDDTLRELGRNGYVLNSYANGTIYYCQLSDIAIEVMESQKKENLLNVLDFISKFIP